MVPVGIPVSSDERRPVEIISAGLRTLSRGDDEGPEGGPNVQGGAGDLSEIPRLPRRRSVVRRTLSLKAGPV